MRLTFTVLFIWGLSFCFGQKTKVHLGHFIEYKDSLFVLTDTSGNSKIIGKKFTFRLEPFKIALEKASVPDRELIWRVIEMYYDEQDCPERPIPSFHKTYFELVFEYDVMAEFFIRETLLLNK